MASQSEDPYAGLSRKAREECARRMARTLTRKPRHKKTRAYVSSLTGKAETAEQVWARAMNEAVASAAQSGNLPMVLRARKERLSPMADKSQRRHATKHCRRASRYQPHYKADDYRAPRDKEETDRLRVLLFEAQRGLCAICGHDMDGVVSLDHVIPHALGGKHGLGNYVATHGECNGDKTNDVPTGCEMVWLLMVNAKLGALPVVF